MSDNQTQQLLRRINKLERRLEHLETIEKPNYVASSTVFARYTRSATQAIPNNTWTILDYNTKDTDSHNAVTTGSGWKFTCPEDGVYHISAQVLLQTYTGWAENEPAMMAVNKNGSGVGYLDRPTGRDFSVGFEYMFTGGSITINCQKGDYLQILFLQWSGISLNTHTDGAWNHVNIHKVNSTLAGTVQAVAAGGSTNSGQAISNNVWSLINYEDISYDTHNTVTTGSSSWTWTCPFTGFYQVSASLLFAMSSTWVENEVAIFGISKDLGSTISYILDRGVGLSGTEFKYVGGSTTLKLQAGETIQFYCLQNSGGTLNLYTGPEYSHFSITKLGSVAEEPGLYPKEVYAKWRSNTAYSYTDSTWTNVGYHEKVNDSHNAGAFNSGTNSFTYTVPISGYYFVHAQIMFAATTTWAEYEFIQLALYANGAYQATLGRPTGLDSSAASQYQMADGTDGRYWTAGTELEIKVYQQSGGTLSLHNSYSYNCFDIFRVGNYLEEPVKTSEIAIGWKGLSDADVNIPGNSVETNLTYNTEKWSSSCTWSSSTNPERVYVTKSGLYLVVLNQFWNHTSNSTGNRRESRIYRYDVGGVGSQQIVSARYAGAALPEYGKHTVTGLAFADAGDYFYATAIQNSGSTLATRPTLFVQMMVPYWYVGADN